MAKKEVLDPGWKWDDDFGFSQAVRCGNLLYVAGQVAIDEKGNVVGVGDLKAQTRQVFENLKKVLALAGADLSDMVDMTMFITDISRMSEIREIRKQYLPEKYPATTAIGTSGLVHPDLMIEVKCTALLKGLT